MQPSWYQNPQLEGGTFTWAGSDTGVLLIHGFTATTAEIRLLASKLRDEGLTTSGVLLPGHGTTPEDLNLCHWQDWTCAVNTAYLQLSTTCHQIFVGGESMGAVLALWLASQHHEITGVLAYAPAIRVPKLWQAVLMSLFKDIRDKGLPEDDLPWQGYTVYPLKAAREFFRLQQEVLGLLPTIHQPILIIQGRKDKTIAPECGQYILSQTNNPKSKLYWLEESPHCLLLDHEVDKATRLTIEFITQTTLIPS